MQSFRQPGPRQARMLELLATRGFLTVRELAEATGTGLRARGHGATLVVGDTGLEPMTSSV